MFKNSQVKKTKEILEFEDEITLPNAAANKSKGLNPNVLFISSTVLFLIAFALLNVGEVIPGVSSKLVGFIFLALGLAGLYMMYSLMQKQENVIKKLGSGSNKNAVNSQATEELFNVMSPISNGDFSHKIYSNDLNLKKLADRIDATRNQFKDMVKKVKDTNSGMASNIADSENTSLRLLEVSSLQYEKMGSSITRVGVITNEMDELAQVTWIAQEESKKSQKASKEGADLVKQSTQKMNQIRETIQDSSKKIKKLGESAQSITEVTSLIQGITKQINILALNAAIQAASSGDAGREFTVVAQEVQRLAYDSEEATRKIEALIDDIQTDTASAVASMEKTTEEVVAGAKLTDSAGRALRQIDELSSNAADQISNAAKRLEDKSSEMATIAVEMQGLQKISEQSSDIIRIASDQIDKFKAISRELEVSVQRFTID